MLAISPRTQDALREQAWPGFIDRVRRALLDLYPHFLPCFPEPIQLRIVTNMVGRARAWGLVQQASIFAFCELMVQVAANFDEDPEINDLLRQEGARLDGALPGLARGLPARTRERAAAAASTLPLYTPAHLAAADLSQRTEAALSVVLHDMPGAAAAVLAPAFQDAAGLGLQAVADGPLVMAACRAFWGEAFLDQDWAVELKRGGWPPPTLLEFFRLRIAAELGRFV